MVTIRLFLMGILTLSLPLYGMEEGSRKRPAQDELAVTEVKRPKMDKKALIAQHNLVQQLKDLRKQIDPETGVVQNPQAFKDFVMLYKTHGLTLKDCVKAFLREKKKSAWQAIKSNFSLINMDEIYDEVKTQIKKHETSFNISNRALVTNIESDELQDYVEDSFFATDICRHLNIKLLPHVEGEAICPEDSHHARIELNKKDGKCLCGRFVFAHELNHLKKRHTMKMSLFGQKLFLRSKQLIDSIDIQHPQRMQYDLLQYKIMEWPISCNSKLKWCRAQEIEADLLAMTESLDLAVQAIIWCYLKLKNSFGGQKQLHASKGVEHPTYKKRLLWARTILQLLKIEKELNI